MEIPNNVKLYEHAIATFWFDELGILHSVSKQGPRTKEIMNDYISFVKNIINDKPVCVIIDGSKFSPIDNKETRDHTGTQLQKIYKAMAIISSTPLGTMLSRIFMQLEGQPYPTAIFQDEKEAEAWVKQYL
jgi:hypothetical protein